MSKNFSRSFSCSRSHKIYIRSNKIKLGSIYAYHALKPLSYDLYKIQDRDKSANRCNGGIGAALVKINLRSGIATTFTRFFLNTFKNFSRSFSRSHKICLRSNKIKLWSTYDYHALLPLSYDLVKIQDRNKSVNRCKGGIRQGSERPWWCHQIGTFSSLLSLCEGNPPATGLFPSQWPVTRSPDVFFDARLNKRLSKQSRCRWFKTPWCSLWL